MAPLHINILFATINAKHEARQVATTVPFFKNQVFGVTESGIELKSLL